ncbi:hypothetical protein SDJN03_23767, partial [Cucurbita argyrosperma subsp. sororia]
MTQRIALSSNLQTSEYSSYSSFLLSSLVRHISSKLLERGIFLFFSLYFVIKRWIKRLWAQRKRQNQAVGCNPVCSV